jgi:replicative DNA helicase
MAPRTNPSAATRMVSDTTQEYLSFLEQIRNGTQTVFPTGSASLEAALHGGLREGSVYVVAGRPAMGKTTFAFTMALNATAQFKGSTATLICSAEFSHTQIIERLIACHGGIDQHQQRCATFDTDEMARLQKAAAHVAELPIFTNSRAQLTGANVREAIADAKRTCTDLKLVVLDPFQYELTATNKPNNIAESTMEELRELAVEHSAAIVIVLPLTRAIERRADKRPMLADLSPSISENADVVMLLYRDDVYFQDSLDNRIMFVYVAKTTFGQNGVVVLDFDAERAQLRERPSTPHV